MICPIHGPPPSPMPMSASCPNPKCMHGHYHDVLVFRRTVGRRLRGTFYVRWITPDGIYDWAWWKHEGNTNCTVERDMSIVPGRRAP